MPWNEINFTIKPNVDFGNAKEQLADVRNGIEGLKHSFEDMPNFTRIMDNSLEKTVTIADNLGNKFEQLSDPSIKDDARSRIETDIQNGVAELNAYRDLRLGQSNYSVELAKSYFGGLPQAVRQELDAITPQVASIIRSKMSTLSNKGSIATGASIGQIAKSLDREARKKDTELNKLLVSSGLSSEGLYQFEDYIKFLIPQVASGNRLKEYQVARYNETLSKTKNYFNRGDPANLFPESFRKSYQSENGRYVQTDLTENELNMVLSANERKRFDEMFASNPIAVKAALASGISRRDDRGLLETKEEISRRDLENFRSAMYDQLINRVAGYATSFVDPYEHIKKLDRETVASRLTQSTSGKTMLALQELEELQNPDLWASSTGNKYYRKNYKEAERQLDEYATLKYSPFLPSADLANYEYSKDNAKTVGISESQATRVLGNGKWINNQDISDTVRLISLAGYDKSKKDHREALYDLYQNGVVIDGEEFVAESTHGKGEDTVIRMLSRKSRDEANARQALWANEAGFTGTYFGNFSEDTIAKNIKDNAMDSVAWGKYFEGQNKKWTPSADLGVNPQNIKVAVVDTTGTLGDTSDFEFGDGAMWLSNMLMRDSAQARIGAAGKGSGFVFQGKDVRALYEKWGLLDENGNAMAKGYNGDNIDISDANVILPKSMLKNKLAYEGKTSEEISKMVTAEAQNLGIGEVVNYNKENTYSNNLGTQAMSFLNFSPAVRMHQIELAKKRLQELDTETGQLQYVFGGDDWFSTQIRNNTRLLGTEQAQKWVDNYKTRLMQNLAAGRFFDFGEGDQKFSNVRAAANPLTTMLMSQYGGITPAVLQKAREYIAKDAAERGVEAPTYTDKELEDLIILKHGNAIDFQHEDQDQLTMLRSPMGYGNILNVRNRAKEARALYEGFGIIGKGERGPGAYASEEDRQVLQGFDYDADQFKIVHDPVLVKEIQAISELQPFVDRKKEIEEQKIQIDNINDPAYVRTEIAGFKKDMQLGMGTYSGGTRAMQLDLTDPTNREYIVGAQQMQALYDLFTTKDKNPKDAKIPQQVWDTVKLGKEFTKFTDHAHELFRFDDDQLDAEGNVDVSNKDVFRSEKTGQFVNLRALRQMGIDEINAPSVNMASHVMGVGLSNLAYQLGMSDTTRWDAIAEAMDALDYGNAGPQRQALMKTMRHMLPEWGSGKRGKLSPNEEKILDQLITNAREELIEEAEGSYNSETKKYVAKDGTEYASVNSYVENQRSKYGIRSAENLLNMFGFTEKRGKAKLGDTFDTFTNLSAFDYIQDVDEEDKKRRERLVKEITDLQNATTESSNTDKSEQQSKNTKSKTRKTKTKSVKNDEPRFGPGAQDRSAESRSYNMGNVDQESLGQQTIDKANGIINEPKTKAEKEITDLQKELALLDEKSGRRIDFRTKMNQILSDARDVSQELWISGKGNENKINDNISLAHSYWNRQFYGTTKPQIELLDELLTEANKSEDFNDSEKSSIRTQVNNVKNDLYRNLNQDFVNKAIAYSKSVAEDIEKEIQKTENEPSSQKKRLNQIDESIKESEGFVAEIQKRMRAKDIPYNQETQDLFGYGLQNVKERITQQQSNRAQLAALYTKENEQNATIAMEALQGKLGYRDKNSLEVQLQNRRQLIQERRDDITKKHSENLMSDSFYQNQIALLDQYDSAAMADVVKENRLALGLDKQTPQEKAADWAKKRIELIDASNKIAMDEAHNKWLNGTGSYEDYVLAQKKYYNADEDEEKRKILEESKQMTNFDAEYQDIRLKNLESANSIQGENLLHRQQLDRDRFRNQLQRRYSRSRIAAGFYSLDDRVLSKQEEIRGYEQTNKRLSGRQAELDKLLTRVDLSDKERKEYTSEKERNADTINTNVQAIANAKQEVEELSSVGARADVVFQSLSQSIGLVAQRLGRQLFQKALQETKRFVKEFDASMNEIQAITLKSDSEMASVRSGTINRAIGLRTSVSNVANTEAALYRQGLSDQEVATRTESIIKFATVTKLNVQEATKIITTALQNDLVGSATEAMDALVALGDSAATTAAEIGKGMQKAAASAKVAGVSYSELTALLTIGTSDTQLSGTQVGTALQTVFSRMRRLSVSGWASDQNGEKTTASDAEAALKTVGVDLWDDKALGKMRSAYDVLSDLSKVWQNLSDAQKNIVMNAMAGTRQTNVFSTLMEGMSEDGGATLEKYLGLAEGSEGVTQSKYEIAMQSLAASMDTLKSSWDSVVESFVSGGSITGILDGVSGFLQMFANSGNIAQGMSLVAGGITGIGVALAALTSTNPAIKALSTILGLASGLIVGGGVAGIASLFHVESNEERIAREYSESYDWATKKNNDRNAQISTQNSAIENVKKLGKAYEEAAISSDKLAQSTAAEKLTDGLRQMAEVFPEVSSEILKAIQDLSNWESAVDSASKKAEEYTKKSSKITLNEFLDVMRETGQDRYNQELFKIDSAEQAQKARKGLINTINIVSPNYRPLSNAEIYTGRKIDESLENGAINLDVAKDALKTEQGQRNLVDLFHIARKESSEFKEYSDNWLSTYHGSIKDDLLNSTDYGDRLNDYSQYIYDLLENIQTASNTSEDENNRLARELSYSWAQKELSSFPLDLLANDNVTKDQVFTAVNNKVLSMLKADTSGKYINKDGSLNVDELANYVNDEILLKWYDKGDNFVKDLVAEELKAEDFEYHIDKNDPNTWFNDYESAIQYIRDHNLGYDQLKDKNGNSAYQTADKLIAAKRQESRTNNRQILLDDILNGYSDVSGFRSMTEEERQEVIKSRNRGYGTDQSLAAKRDYYSLLNGNKVAALSTFNSLEEANQAYSKAGLDDQFAKAISSSEKAVLGYITDDLDLVIDGLSEQLNGGATEASRAEGIGALLDKLSENRGELITLIETDFEETYKSILSYFGEENGKAIFSSMRNDTYKGSDWEKLVNRTLAENSLKPDAGLTQYTQREIADLASQAMSSNFGSLAEFAKNQGWTKSQYEAVKNAYGAEIDRYKNMTETQRADIEGLNLKRDFDVKIAVAGISELESANKVLQGTTRLIENLKKGGQFEIKAKLQMESDSYNFEQQVAMLQNGTPEEQMNALMSLNPGWSRARIEANMTEARANADRAIQDQREQTAGSLTALSKTMGLDYALQEAEKMGYTTKTNPLLIEDALREINKHAPSSQPYQYDEENGELYWIGENTGIRYAAPSAFQNWFDRLAFGEFVSTGEVQDIDRENPLYGLQRSKTSYEIEQAQRRILEGATQDDIGDYELYSQAVGRLTQNQKDYLAARATVQSMNGHYNDYTQKEFDDAVNAMYGLQTAAYADFGYKTRDEIYNAASLYNPITNPQFYDDYASIVGSDIAERRADQNYTLTAPEERYATLRMQRYAQGYDGITQIDKIQGAYDMIQSIEDGTYQDKYGKASEDMKKDFTSAATGLDELIDAYLSLDKNAVDYAEKEAIIKDRLTDTKAALKTAAVEAKGYGEANSKAAKSMGELAKGGLAQKKEIAQLTKQAKDYQDAITAAQKSTGKTGKQIAKDQVAVKQFGKIGFDKSDIEQWSKEEATEYSKLLEDSIQENFGTEMLQPLVQQALDEINAQPFEVRPKINMITNPQTGELDFSQLAAVVAQYNESLAAALEFFNGILAEAHVQVVAKSDGKGNGDVKVVADSSTFKSARVKGGGRGGSYNNKGGGGGGGGGKSATDKLLEKQKQRMSEIEHQSKMLEIQEKYLDFTNDYDNYSSNIDQQIANQERLRSAYAQSIQELKNQLATLERGSDDWNKANEQLMQYEENLENIKNTINDLGAKRITIVEQKQENEDRRGSHNLNMLSKMAARYQKSGQFESYEGIMEQTIEETRKQIHLNDKQITEWENLLKTFTENSDSWIQTRDKIWAMREENAELQNQMASDLIDLQEARISQIAEDLQNQKAPLEHRANMLDTYGQMYESVNDFTKYRGTLEGTIDTNRQMKEMTDAAIAQVKKQIDGMRDSDPARQSAIQTLYELEEASAQYEASILSNQQAIEESLISELTQAHQDSGSILEHELKLLSEAEKEFTRNDDFINYENILEEKARNASDRLKDQQNALEDYLALQNSGKITEGGQQWRELEDTIRSTKENVASLRNEWQEALQTIEKAKFTNLKETFAETYDLSQHQQKLVQYDQTRYQNNGQLTNYGTALEWEGKILEDQRDSIQNHIKDLEEQLQESKEFPELYKEITKEIMTWEEKLADTNNRIEKNTELIEKNQDAIRKARIAVENEADKAIRAWIQKQRNMLSATVTMQNNIFAIISKNYQQQWALEQKTLDKKKQTLNEEKNLINERVNFRKKMMDQEAKDEELAEYRRQLALISQDTTRTREANELRRKIQDMEKEQAMQNAQDIANAEIQSLNDQSKAIDDYAATYQENLTELLSNINNFKDIIDGLLSGSFEDFVNWNAEYNEDFKKSSDEQRQQLINGWEDTWYTMLGQLRTYWDQVDESMQSRDGFLELLKTQDEYLKLSDTGRESYLYRAGELYDSFTASMIDDATFSDNHEIIDTINDLKDWTFNVNIAGLGNYDFGGTISDYVYNRDRSVIPYEYDSDYKGVGYVAPPPAPAPAPTSSSGGGGSSSGSGTSSSRGSKKIWDIYDEKGNKTNWTVEAYTVEEANQIALKKYGKYYSAATHMDFPSATKKTSTSTNVVSSAVTAGANFIKNFFGFSEGGEVDYTGLAMVHGTPQKPEAFLNAEDRANMRAMLDAFNYVKAPTMTHIDPSMYGTTTNNYGDVNITINEAKINNDQDISALAQKIGKEFTKELSKSGFNTASYAW